MNSGALDPMEEVWKDLSFELIRLGYVLPDVKYICLFIFLVLFSYNFNNIKKCGHAQITQIVEKNLFFIVKIEELRAFYFGVGSRYGFGSFLSLHVSHA